MQQLLKRSLRKLTKAEAIEEKFYIIRTKEEKQYLREHNAEEWLKTEGNEYRWGSSRYLMSGKFKSTDQPFPSNRFFKIDEPLGDKLKSEIFTKYIADPDRNSPVNLSSFYKLSIDRIKAIIKLKWLEKSMEARDLKLQHHYQTCMDKLLQSVNSIDKIKPEVSVRMYKSREAPIFIPSETKNMSATKAAKAMHTEPFSKQIDRIKNAVSSNVLIPSYLSEAYCPTLEKEIKNVNSLPALATKFTSSKLGKVDHNPINYIKGTVQYESNNPIYVKPDPLQFKPKTTHVFVDINNTKATPKVIWNPSLQGERPTPKVESGKIVVRDNTGKLRTPNAIELRLRKAWGLEIVNRKLYKKF